MKGGSSLVNTVVKILILIFISAILILLASYSTVFKARAKRTALVYEIVAGILIVSDNNLMLGAAEFVILQVMTIFSVIASLYAYVNIEILSKKDSKECTTLVVLPFKKQEVEVDANTVDSIRQLTYCVFCVCLGVLILIRPALLFPFYGKNWALFTVSLLIITINFWIASTNCAPRATDSLGIEEDAKSFKHFSLITVSFFSFIIVQLFTSLIYSALDEETRNNITAQIPTYSAMLPINEHYDYKEDLPNYLSDRITQIDDVYLIKYSYTASSHSGDKYYLNLGDPDLLCITEGIGGQKVSIHVKGYDGPYNTPCIKKTEKTYTNLRGETKVSETIYDIYIQDEEQILTY